MKYVTDFQKDIITLNDKTELKVSRSKKKEVKQALLVLLAKEGCADGIRNFIPNSHIHRTCIFSINVFPIILLFSIGIQKRKHFAWRIVLGFLISVCCSAPFSHGLFTYIMQFTLFVFSSYFAYEISWKEALYSVTCAYAVQHISYCVYLILFRPVHGIPVYAPAYIVCAVCIALCCTGLSEENYLKMDIMMWIFVSL